MQAEQQAQPGEQHERRGHRGSQAQQAAQQEARWAVQRQDEGQVRRRGCPLARLPAGYYFHSVTSQL